MARTPKSSGRPRPAFESGLRRSQASREEARRRGIEVAVSNPCFELWLLLHFADHTAHAATYKALLPYLQRHRPGYDKTRVDFADYRDGWRAAGVRARRLADEGRECEVNPATGVWRLVERIADGSRPDRTG
ncbi:RloB family protein [Streptomyces sp. CA-111067]|uniref:RloB family protein n=1 Tax=Streptomyces sp. CA-111067 TaxID=3240046 RepID=UPI003D979423